MNYKEPNNIRVADSKVIEKKNVHTWQGIVINNAWGMISILLCFTLFFYSTSIWVSSKYQHSYRHSAVKISLALMGF